MMLTQLSVHLKQRCNGISLQKRTLFSQGQLHCITKILSCQISKFNAICTFLFIHLSIKKFVLQADGCFQNCLLNTPSQLQNTMGVRYAGTWKYFKMIKTHNQSVADIRNNHFEQHLLFLLF